MNEISKERNLGFQYVLDEIAKKRAESDNNIFTEKDFEFSDIIYQISNTSSLYSKSSPSTKFNPHNQSFITNFETIIANIFKPLDLVDEDFDTSQIYENTKNLNLKSLIHIKMLRLSNLFKGKEELNANLTLPIQLDFSSLSKLEDNAHDYLIDFLAGNKQIFYKSILGNNVGITEDLKDAFGMTPPIISIKVKTNATSIYCDNPLIDDVYDQDESKIVDRLKLHFLTRITIDDIYKKCDQNIEYVNDYECVPYENVCHAVVCHFKRYIYDGCKQKSNVVDESVIILPRSPYFIEFPDNIGVSCDESANATRYIMPKVNPGCRGSLYALFYNDKLDNRKCEQKIYRKWRAEIFECENELFDTRVQQLYVQDKLPPIFTSFPADKRVEFFEAYGTENNLEYPRAYDKCGHEPSIITYNDTLFKLATGKRTINRVWSVSDACGNKYEQIQKIHVENMIENCAKWDFRKYLTYSFTSLNLTEAVVRGEIGSRDEITLLNTQVFDQDFKNYQCTNLEFKVISANPISLR